MSSRRSFRVTVIGGEGSAGRLLHARIREAGLSQTTFGRLLGTGQAHVSRICNGEKPITPVFAVRCGYVFDDMAFARELAHASCDEQFDAAALKVGEESTS